MDIEILRADSKKWQSQYAPIQRKITAKKGGLVVIFTAQKGDEAGILNAFHVHFLKIREKSPKGRMLKDCRWEEIYSDFSNDGSEIYLLIVQIHSYKSFSECYFAASELVNIYSQCRDSIGY